MASQRTRVVAAVTVAVLPLAALALVHAWQEYEREKARVVEERLALAATAAFAAQVFVDRHVSAARSIALHPALARGRASPELERYLERVAREHPDWAGIGAAGADGRTFVGTSGGPSLNLGDRPYFRKAMATGKPVVSSAVIGRRTQRPTIVIGVPFELVGGRRGLLVTPMPTEQFGAQLTEKIGLPAARLAMIDDAGQTFLHPDPARVAALASMRGLPAAEAALRGESGSIIRQADGAETLVVYAPVPQHGWAVLLSEPVASAFAEARASALERLLALAAALALVFAIAWLLGGRLAHAREQLERALRTRDEFLAAASHDLRNPLTAIRASVELLQRGLARGNTMPPERIAGTLRHIERGCARMVRQLDEFMDVARLQLGAPLELRHERVDLVPLLGELIDECGQASPRHAFALQAPAALHVDGDASRLQRAVGNLLENAVQYSPHGGPVEVSLARSPEGERAVLRIADHGIGIPPADVERVFRRFERGSNAAGRIPGTGIGLAGARQIIEQHGGAISVRSILGEGSIFTVSLPAAPPREMPSAAEERAA